MAVVETTQSPEEKQAEQSQKDKAASDIAQNIIKTLDLPTSIKESVDGAEKEDGAETQESSDGTESENPDESKGAEAEASVEESSASDKEEREPDSVQKRIDELTREKKLLESRLKKLESKSSPEPVDSDLEKLRKMSVDELKETRKKILKAQRTADEATLDQLFELEEKVNKTIEDAPKRFQSNQLERFNEAVSNTSDLTEKELQVVFGHAKNIFSRTPSFQNSLDGQAEAWNLAVEHYKEMNKLTVGKSKVNELERKVNDLKKKTSLDTVVQKGNTKLSEESRLFNKAKSGTMEDKQAFLKKRLNTDALIPEEYRQ